MTFDLILLITLSGIVGGGFLYIRRLSVNASKTKELIEKNKQIQVKYKNLQKIEDEKTTILKKLYNNKSGSTGYKRILSELSNKWNSEN